MNASRLAGVRVVDRSVWAITAVSEITLTSVAAKSFLKVVPPMGWRKAFDLPPYLPAQNNVHSASRYRTLETTLARHRMRDGRFASQTPKSGTVDVTIGCWLLQFTSARYLCGVKPVVALNERPM